MNPQQVSAEDSRLISDRHEEELIDLFASDGWSCFVDIGAHCGAWIKGLSGCYERAIAFEPHPGAFMRLSDNIERWGLDEYVMALKFAVCDSDDPSIPMQIYADACHSTIMPDHPMPETLPMSQNPETIYVEPIKLDTALHSIPDVDLIKIDTEGAELAVLAGAKYVIEKYNPLTVIECHSQEHYDILRDVMVKPRFFNYRNSSRYLIGRFH